MESDQENIPNSHQCPSYSDHNYFFNLEDNTPVFESESKDILGFCTDSTSSSLDQSSPYTHETCMPDKNVDLFGKGSDFNKPSPKNFANHFNPNNGNTTKESSLTHGSINNNEKSTIPNIEFLDFTASENGISKRGNFLLEETVSSTGNKLDINSDNNINIGSLESLPHKLFNVSNIPSPSNELTKTGHNTLPTIIDSKFQIDNDIYFMKTSQPGSKFINSFTKNCFNTEKEHLPPFSKPLEDTGIEKVSNYKDSSSFDKVPDNVKKFEVIYDENSIVPKEEASFPNEETIIMLSSSDSLSTYKDCSDSESDIFSNNCNSKLFRNKDCSPSNQVNFEKVFSYNDKLASNEDHCCFAENDTLFSCQKTLANIEENKPFMSQESLDAKCKIPKYSTMDSYENHSQSACDKKKLSSNGNFNSGGENELVSSSEKNFDEKNDSLLTNSSLPLMGYPHLVFNEQNLVREKVENDNFCSSEENELVFTSEKKSDENNNDSLLTTSSSPLTGYPHLVFNEQKVVKEKVENDLSEKVEKDNFCSSGENKLVFASEKNSDEKNIDSLLTTSSSPLIGYPHLVFNEQKLLQEKVENDLVPFSKPSSPTLPLQNPENFLQSENADSSDLNSQANKSFGPIIPHIFNENNDKENIKGSKNSRLQDCKSPTHPSESLSDSSLQSEQNISPENEDFYPKPKIPFSFSFIGETLKHSSNSKGLQSLNFDSSYESQSVTNFLISQKGTENNIGTSLNFKTTDQKLDVLPDEKSSSCFSPLISSSNSNETSEENSSSQNMLESFLFKSSSHCSSVQKLEPSSNIFLDKEIMDDKESTEANVNSHPLYGPLHYYDDIKSFTTFIQEEPLVNVINIDNLFPLTLNELLKTCSKLAKFQNSDNSSSKPILDLQNTLFPHNSYFNKINMDLVHRMKKDFSSKLEAVYNFNRYSLFEDDLTSLTENEGILEAPSLLFPLIKCKLRDDNAPNEKPYESQNSSILQDFLMNLGTNIANEWLHAETIKASRESSLRQKTVLSFKASNGTPTASLALVDMNEKAKSNLKKSLTKYCIGFTYFCKKCTFFSENPQIFVEHVESSHINPIASTSKGIVSCLLCSRKFLSSSQLKKHLSMCAKVNPILSPFGIDVFPAKTPKPLKKALIESLHRQQLKTKVGQRNSLISSLGDKTSSTLKEPGRYVSMNKHPQEKLLSSLLEPHDKLPKSDMNSKASSTLPQKITHPPDSTDNTRKRRKLNSEMSDYNFVCELCDGHLQTLAFYQLHFERKHNFIIPLSKLSDPIFKCNHCFRNYVTVEGFSRHFIIKHGLGNNSKDFLDSGTCGFCFQIIDHNLKSHIETRHRIQIQDSLLLFKCIHCAQTLSSYPEYIHHFATLHCIKLNND